MSLCLRFVLICAANFGNGFSWPVPYDLNADTLPNLEVSLAPPQDPFPREAKVMREQEQLRETTNVAHMDGLQRASRKVLVDVRTRAARIIERAMHMVEDVSTVGNSVASRASTSFLENQMEFPSDDNIALSIDVPSSNVPNATWIDDVVAFEHGTDAAAQRAYEEDVSDMTALSESILQELEAQLHAQLGSLNAVIVGLKSTGTTNITATAFAALLGEDNIHVVSPTEPFPEPASFVQAMGTRASITDQLARWKVLEIDAHLFKAERRIIKELLDGAVGRAASLLAASATSM